MTARALAWRVPVALAWRVPVALTLALGALSLDAGPAAADPAVPTHYRATVTAVAQADGAPIDLDVEVLGGDAFLVVSVPSGTTLAVPGYEGEPYIRIHDDGTVEVNQRSPARWLNDERYGLPQGEVPASADADAPPDWEVVARRGTYAWHDHRIHYMSPQLPPQVDPSRDEVQRVWEWEVPVTIDGADAVIAGELDWVPGPSPVVPVITLLGALALALLAVRLVGSDPLIVLAALLTAVLAAAQNLDLPAGADGLPALWALPGLAMVVWLLGRLHPTMSEGRRALLRGLAVVPPLVGAALLGGALVRPIVPGALPTAVTRGVVAAIIAASVAALVPLLRDLWAATSLDPGTEPEPDAEPTA